MTQHWPAGEIARMILDGFDDYREHFRRITLGARERFEQARWQDSQRAAAARINLYEQKVGEVNGWLRDAFDDEVLLEVEQWPLVKSAYIRLIDRAWTMSCQRPGTTHCSAACSAMTRSATAACSSTPPGRPSAATSAPRKPAPIAPMAICRACYGRFFPTMHSPTPTLKATCHALRSNCANACRIGCAKTRCWQWSCFRRCCTATRVPTWSAGCTTAMSSGRW